MMRKNKVQDVLAAKRIPIGHMIVDFNVRGIAKMLEVVGVDFVVIDMEHGGFSHADVADLVGWFKATPIAPFVRVPVGTYAFIARALDTGALGIMVPNVRTGDEAQEIVAAAKYPPLGKRGLTFGSAVNDYENVTDIRGFMRDSNRLTTIICQIESEEALGNLDAIAGTEGVDMLWVGQFDLTNSMGIPGDFESSRFHDALRLVIDTAHKHDKLAAIQSGNPLTLAIWATLGLDVVSFGEDTGVYMEAMANNLRTVRGSLEQLERAKQQ